MKRRFIHIILPLLLFSGMARSQTVYYHIQNEAVYEFLDEMAGAGLITLNSSVKPYSRMFIARQMASLDTLRSQLNPRQQKELDFYLKDFNKELKPDKNFDKRFDIFYYKDSLFTFSANLILGAEYTANANGNAFFWWNGAEIFAYAGKLGVWASLRDHHDKEKLVTPEYLTQLRGGSNLKSGIDWEEMRGGITWSWKWGNVGLTMDHNSWGSGYNGTNIQSGRTPSIARIDLKMKPVHWFEFNYYHGWLVSEEVDSSRSYMTSSAPGAVMREVYHPKYFATNIFTFTPLRKLNISVGNSIVYTDMGPHPGYLLPVLFYKAVDHSVNARTDNMNSQMFLDVSSRNIRNLHLYGTWYVDEVNTANMFKPDKHSNLFSWKLGGRLSNFPVQNLSVTGEWTRSNALVFRHYVNTLTYASNRYNMGHYLTDNAREYYFAVGYRPVRGLDLRLSWMMAQKGPDHTALGSPRLGIKFLESVEWENQTIALRAHYQIINDAYVFASWQYSNIHGKNLAKYTHPIFHGKTNTFRAGLNFGF
ncbi:hypothetical protein ACFLTA_03215 [Bacteroidota bacterium]